nr:ABC transporter ATP-binding protein [Wenjunlia tyrosinilytica]
MPPPGPARLGSPTAQPSTNFKVTAGRLLALMRSQRSLLLWMLALGLTSIVLNVVGPMILGHATDLIFSGFIGHHMPAGATRVEVIDHYRQQGDGTLADMLRSTDFTPGRGIDFTMVHITLIAALAASVGNGACWIIQGRVTTKIVQRTAFQLRGDIEAKLARLPLSYFDRQPRGEVLSRATNDIDNIVQTLQQTVSSVTNSLLLIVGVLAMMFWISPLLALVALVIVPISVFLTSVLRRRAAPQFARQWKTTGELNAHIEEVYTAHDLVRAHGLQADCDTAFRRLNDSLSQSVSRAQSAGGIVQPALTFLTNASYVLVAVIGGLQVAMGGLSVGAVQAFIQYSRLFSGPLTQLMSLVSVVQSGVASAERVFELLDATEQSGEPELLVGQKPRQGYVRFEDVFFRYEPDKPLIEGLSLSVEPGQTVAIVGATGAGKTTLVNLLLRFYEIDSGRITVDGVDASAMSRDDLRSGIGMVMQDVWLFSGTIAENIAFGTDGATREAIEEAARAALADRFIRTLPQGYDTLIGVEGTELSIGEKQLLTIARVFLVDPVIHVLDEATSSVDTRTEVLVQRAMARLSQGRTSFVIAHRLSTIREADVILVLEDGTIVEQGKHAQLLATGGTYARLHAAQFMHSAENAE